MKRFFSLVLVLVMVMSLNPVAYSVEPAENKSVEEILDAYHYKISSINNDAANRSTYSLNAIREKNQIKQDTMEELADAGYEAYDVNPDTYESVANALQTDLSALGIEQEGSYIVVVSGEPDVNSGIAPAAVTPPPSSDGDPNAFSYLYDGEYYRLRYVTIYADGNYGYAVAEEFDLVNGENDPEIISDYLLTAVSIAVDQVLDELQYVGTLLSVCGLDMPSPTYIRNFTLSYHAGTNWTRKFTQVWHEDLVEWHIGSCVEYVTSFSYVTGIFYDRTLNRFTDIPGERATSTVYSNHYSNQSWIKENAVKGFIYGSCRFDRTGPVKYYHNGSLITTHSFSGVPY